MYKIYINSSVNAYSIQCMDTAYNIMNIYVLCNLGIWKYAQSADCIAKTENEYQSADWHAFYRLCNTNYAILIVQSAVILCKLLNHKSLLNITQ